MSEIIVNPNSPATGTKTRAPIIQRKEDPGKKMTKEALAKKMPEMYERDHEMVTGIFRYLEKPGQRLEFTFKKYAEDDNETYKLQDGQRYTLPRMIARHLSKNCYYVEYAKLQGKLAGTGVMAGQTGKEGDYANQYQERELHRTEFRSLEFMDEDLEPTPNLYKVSYT